MPVSVCFLLLYLCVQISSFCMFFFARMIVSTSLCVCLHMCEYLCFCFLMYKCGDVSVWVHMYVHGCVWTRLCFSACAYVFACLFGVNIPLCMWVCHFACVYYSVYCMYISISMVVPLYVYAHASVLSHFCIFVLFLHVLQEMSPCFPSCLSSICVHKCRRTYACIWEHVQVFHLCVCTCFCLYSLPACWGMRCPCIGIPLHVDVSLFLYAC